MANPEGQGDRWFDETYRSNYPAVVRYAYRRLRDKASAEELAQEVFYVAWRRRHEIDNVTPAWLYAVARRLLLSEWRMRRKHPAVVGLGAVGAVGATSPCEGIPLILDLHAAMARLDERDREILQLVGWEQLTVGEAAGVLGCSRVAAATRLMRARRRLATALEISSNDPARQSADTMTSTRKVGIHA